MIKKIFGIYITKLMKYHSYLRIIMNQFFKILLIKLNRLKKKIKLKIKTIKLTMNFYYSK